MKTTYATSLCAAITFGIIGVTNASAGNYSDGVQIGPEPTQAQRSYHQRKMKSHYTKGYRHENAGFQSPMERVRSIYATVRGQNRSKVHVRSN